MATMVSPGAGTPKAQRVEAGVAPLRAGQGHQFILRRLHSLTGIIPVGAFLFEHILISNATAINGPVSYYRQVQFLVSLPLVVTLELFGIWLPLAYHALYGFYIWYKAEPNPIRYSWMGNWMYTLQRWTGGIAFIYIVYHTLTMRFTGVHLPGLPAAAFGKVQAELANPWLLAFWIVGLVTASWHFAYGIWLFCAKWGIVIGERARKRLLVLCLGFFVVMAGVGIASIRSFRAYPQQPVELGPQMDKIINAR